VLIQVGQVTPQRLLALFERPELFDLPAQADERFAIHTRLLQFPQNPFIGNLRCLFLLFPTKQSAGDARVSVINGLPGLGENRLQSGTQLSEW